MNSHLKELEERIAYEFKNKNLFTQALTHSSYALPSKRRTGNSGDSDSNPSNMAL